MGTILDVISGVGVMAIMWFLPVMAIWGAVSVAVDQWVLYITANDVDPQFAAKIKRFWSRILYSDFEMPVVFYLIMYMMAMAGLTAAYFDGKIDTHPVLLPYVLGQKLSVIGGLLFLSVGGTMLARYIYILGRKVKRLSDNLTDHINNKEIHKG